MTTRTHHSQYGDPVLVRVCYEDGNQWLEKGKKGDYNTTTVSNLFWQEYEKHRVECARWQELIQLLDQCVELRELQTKLIKSQDKEDQKTPDEVT